MVAKIKKMKPDEMKKMMVGNMANCMEKAVK